MTAQAPERAFPVFGRGAHRDHMLRSWRIGLRTLTNPDTGLPFTEREIAAATAERARYWSEAEAVDLVLLSGEQRAIYLADQVRMDRAASSWLERYHGGLWDDAPLPASGGSGTASAVATVGTIFHGSTTLPDPTAVQATDPAGKRYQVLYSVTTPAGGTASPVLKGIDTGSDTNLPVGTVLTWSQNRPTGAAEKATVAAQYTGGAPKETSAQFASRLRSTVRHKAASGNDSHIRYWARRATTAVEDAFVYACALHAGTSIVCITQKRAGVLGPAARIPSIGTLSDVTSYLVPPGSPVVPKPPLILVVPPVSQSSDLVLAMSMPVGVSSGWADLIPWPEQYGGAAATITAVASQVQFTLTVPASSAALPSGVTAPGLMVWDASTSRYEKLEVSLAYGGHPAYTIQLSSAPTHTLAMGDVICPDTARRLLIAQSTDNYFDSLGPGELVDLSNDPRAHRAARFPLPSEDYPLRAGSGVNTWLQDALGASLADISLESVSSSLPTVPSDPTAGPALMVAGKVGVYPL